MRWLQGAVVNLVYPPECLWCSEPIPDHERFCEPCRRKMVSDYYRCQRCATPLPTVIPNQDCFRCRDSNWRFDRVITLGPYSNDLRQAVILMKKSYQEPLRRGLGELLAQEALSIVLPKTTPPLVIPVPNHWTHALRGVADAAGSLAGAISRRTGWELNNALIRRSRKTAKQGMLSWAERRQNVRGAFKIKQADRVNARHVILVDDVLTSGATATELASRLKRAGASVVDVLVVARGTGARESPLSTDVQAASSKT